jgi:23S rRNA (adenine2030-N6)-methyltransferase
MNYRHVYHAGNICDVAKHSVLCLLLRRLTAKEAAFCVVDTHAGIGLYDLDDEKAKKTGEADEGIRKLFAAAEMPDVAELCGAYLALCRSFNPSMEADGVLRHYPGSPSIARAFLRPQDRLVLCELHDEDVPLLRRCFRGDKQVHIHHRDGYEALRGLLPPPEKRGLVFIDPPFEKRNEFETLVDTCRAIAQRWANATVAIWYPIKDRAAIWAFHESLIALGVPKIFCAEFLFEEEIRADRLNGSGFVFLNPPWKLDAELAALFPALHRALDCGAPDKRVDRQTLRWLS